MRTQFLERIVPGDLLKLARAARAGALQRMRDAVGMVDHLKPGLAPRAQFAKIDGMLRIALELFRQAHLDEAGLAVAHDLGVALHHAHQQPATRRTQRADARLPSGDARNQLFLRNKADELLLRTAAGLERGRGARERRNFEEITPFHMRSPAPNPSVQ